MKKLEQNRINTLTLVFCASAITLLIIALYMPYGADVLAINGAHNPWLDEFFKALTELGNGLILVPLFITALFIQFRLAAIVAAAGALHGILSAILKKVVFSGMPRPKAVLDNDLLHFVQGVSVHTTNSFPSGHTATAFVLFFLLCHFFSKKMEGVIAMIAMAVLVGISRVYLAQHFLIDVACGALLGTFSAWLCSTWLMESKSLPPWMYMRIRFKLPTGNSATPASQL